MITQSINLNLIPGQVLPRVNVSQYDSGTRTLHMAIYNGNQAFSVPSGVTGVVQGTKPDRMGFQYAATVTAGSNIAEVDITQQMTAVSGEVPCELVLSQGDDRIATVNFIIFVEPAALADDTIISETELPLIEEAAELAEQIQGIIAQIDADADRAEGYAVGTKDGQPVPSTDPTYNNNAKYYADEAAASAASVGTLAEDAEAWAVGERGGVPVTSGDPTYHNNSEYYAGTAGDSATAASSSELNAASSEENAEAWAVGERGGTPVSSGDTTYQNNAKYYAGEASTSATNAGTSESNASGSASAAAQSEEDAEAWAVGERNGTPVPSTDPTYQNNAKYYAQSIGVPAISTLTDVTLTSLADGDFLQYNSTSTKWENVSGDNAKADKTDVAPVEDSSTASQGYSIGDQFYYNNILYTATAAISQNGTITPGTNCDPSDDLTDQIEAKDDKPVELVQTLAAGSTQVTFTNAAITANCNVQIMTNQAGLNWTAIDDSTLGTLIITFPAQSSPVSVKLIIRG